MIYLTERNINNLETTPVVESMKKDVSNIQIYPVIIPAQNNSQDLSTHIKT